MARQLIWPAELAYRFCRTNQQFMGLCVGLTSALAKDTQSARWRYPPPPLSAETPIGIDGKREEFLMFSNEGMSELFQQGAGCNLPMASGPGEAKGGQPVLNAPRPVGTGDRHTQADHDFANG